MTPKQADKLIKSGRAVTINFISKETGTFKFIRRNGRRIYCETGEIFLRDDIISWEQSNSPAQWPG